VICLTSQQEISESQKTADREHDDSKEFRQFRRNLFHASLSHILQTLRAGMSKPVVIRYADGYYRRTIFGLGPYIADYPEQVLLGCVVQDWCPRYVCIQIICMFTKMWQCDEVDALH
jgi:hypothetical protein